VGTRGIYSTQHCGHAMPSSLWVSPYMGLAYIMQHDLVPCERGARLGGRMSGAWAHGRTRWCFGDREEDDDNGTAARRFGQRRDEGHWEIDECQMSPSARDVYHPPLSCPQWRRVEARAQGLY
jgi:hypothetical protein